MSQATAHSNFPCSRESPLEDGLEAALVGLWVGCCGLAGSFGFEAEHYDLSVKIAEHRLLPLLREQPEDTLIIADGFSCRTQIEQLTERQTTHTAELVSSALDALSGR